MNASAVNGPWTTALRAICLMVVVSFAAVAANTATAQAATPGWKAMAVTGPTHLPTVQNEQQLLTVPSGFGFYSLGFGADQIPFLLVSSTAADIEAGLNALPSIAADGGSVSVTDGPSPSTFIITFDGGPLAGTDVPSLTYSSFFGGSVGPAPSGYVAINVFNVGGAPTSGTYTMSLELPPGIVTSGDPEPRTAGSDAPNWECVAAGPGQATASCTRTAPVLPGSSATTIDVPVAVAVGVSAGQLTGQVSVSGGGAASDGEFAVPITVNDTPATRGVQAFFAGAFDENGNPETRAGRHPNLAMAAFQMNTILGPAGKVIPAGGDTRQINVDLPAGFVGNPLIAPRCPRADAFCGGDSWVGHLGFETEAGAGFNRAGLSNVLPQDGSAAQLTFRTLETRASIAAKPRPSDYGVATTAENITPDLKFFGSFVTLWGEPGDAFYDSLRCSNHISGVCPEPYSSSVDRAFLTNPTECSGEPLTTLVGTFAWQAPGVFAGPVGSDSPAVTDCGDVPFEPAVSVEPTTDVRDSASGVDFELELPQDGLLDPDEIATSHLKDVVVDLPEGLSVNPSGATGLEGCSDAQMQVGSDSVPACPDGSKLGTVEVTSPLVDRAIEGALYLGTPRSTDPLSGEMLRLFVVARNDQLGVMVKLPGSATADPNTGKLTATFRNNPRLPFDHLSVKLKGGDRGVLATPQACGSQSIAATLSPWSGTVPVTQSTPTSFGGDCSRRFAPTLSSGMNTPQARANGTFSFHFARRDGEQWLRGLTAKLPTGLLASVRGIPLCSNAAADAGSCPAASKIGIVDAAAGAGSPFVLEEKGEVFLTEGYKGGAYGLAVKIRGVAGPFRGNMELSPIIVRQAVHVDPTTAQVSAVSDPFPLIHHGVPLRVREVTVLLNRDSFTLNPSDCAQKQVQAQFASADGAAADVAYPFRAAGCSALPFKPRLALSLTGRKQVTTGKHPGVKAQVNQAGVGEAGIERAEVRLPKSLALDPNNAQALCEFADGTKPDLENRCPKGSIVGRARAVTPLLNEPLTGNVYFVKNVRRDPTTGNEIRTLPMLIVALRGEIAINLRGESSTTNSGKLVNTFASVPDGPITQFNMNIKGGKNGILAVTRTRKARINLCTGRHIAEADIDGHNGKRHDFDVRMKTPCGKASKKAAAKRKAKPHKR